MSRLLIALLFLVSCKTETATSPERPVKAIQVSESSKFENELTFPGTLRAFRRADLSFRVDGTVIMRDITVGYRAKKEEVLIRLDPREYEIALKKAQGKVESTKAQLDFADRDYQRMRGIFERDPGAISESLLDRKKETFNQLKAEFTVAESDHDKAEDDLSYTVLRAPFDGIIAAIYVENHEQVRAKQPVLRFLDTAEREMEINIPERYIDFFLKGEEKLNFDISLDAFPNTRFTAKVKEIGTEASTSTQTYPVTLSLQEIPPDTSLLAGMSGRAILKQQSEKKEIFFQIPKSAIFTGDGEKTFVWIVDPKTETIHKKGVSLDPSNRKDIAVVKEGLQVGDWVVTAGTSFLNEGQKVKLVSEQTKS